MVLEDGTGVWWQEREPDIRRLSDMREVIFDQSWLAAAEDFELYYMYRDLFLSRGDGGKAAGTEHSV